MYFFLVLKQKLNIVGFCVFEIKYKNQHGNFIPPEICLSICTIYEIVH